MSNAIENRVVEMRFDNKQFEEGVADSIQSLDRLNKSLNMQEGIKGLEGIQSMANTLNLDNVARDVSYLTDWFSIMGTVGQQVVVRLTDAFLNLGGAMTRMISELTVGQISAGFDKYEEKTKAVQTIMNATGKDIETVDKQMQKLNWYTDETSYSFTGMVNNIAKFTSNGVALDQAVTSMMGIGNAAGLAGASVSDATHAMDGFSKAMGQGYMNRLNWQWIKTAHMDTQQFKRELIDAAVAEETLMYVGEEAGEKIYETIDGNRVTVNNFEEALKDGWMNVDVMNTALSHFGDTTETLYQKYKEFEGEYTTSELIEMYAEDLDALGIKAFRAAQEAKTFTDAIEAVKDAVSTGWMNSFELIFGNYEEAKVIWTELANELWDVFASGAEARNEMLREWHDMGGYQKAIQAIKNVWHTIRNIVDPLNEVFRDFFPATTAERLYLITSNLERFTAHVRDLFSAEKELKSFDDIGSDDASLLGTVVKNEDGIRRLETIRTIFSAFISVFRVLADAAQAVVHAFSPLFKTFAKIADVVLEVVGVFADLILRFNNAIHESQIFMKVADLINAALEKMNRVLDPIIRIIKNIIQYMHDLIESLSGLIAKIGELDSVKTLIGHFNNFVTTIRTKVSGVVDKLIDKLNKLAKIDLKAPSTEDFLKMIDFLVTKFNEFIEGLSDTAKESGLTGWFQATYQIIRDTVGNIWNSLMGSVDSEGSFFNKAYNAAASFAQGILEGLNTVTFTDMASAAGVAGLGWMLYEVINLIWDLQKTLAVKDFSLEGVMQLMLKPFTRLSDVLLAFSKNIKADTLIKQANAIAILTGAIVVLSSIDKDSLASAVGAIIALMLGMKAIMDSMTAYTSIRSSAGGVANRLTSFLEGIKSALRNAVQFQSLGLMFLEIAAAMVIMAAAIKKLNDIQDLNPNVVNTLWAIFGGIAVVMLAAKAQFSKDGVGSWFMGVNWAAIGVLFLGMGVAISMIVGAINKIATEIDPKVLGEGLTVVGGLGALLAILFGVIGKTNANTGQMVGFAGSMFLLAGAITAMIVPFKLLGKLNKLELAHIKEAVDEIGKIMALMAGIMVATSLTSIGKKGVFGIDFAGSGGTEIIKMAVALTILAGAMILLGANAETASAGVGIFNQAAGALMGIFITMGLASLASSLKKTGDNAKEAGGGFKNLGIGIGAAFGGIGVFLIGLSMVSDKIDTVANGIGKISQAIVDNAGVIFQAILIVAGAIASAIVASKKHWIIAGLTLVATLCEVIDAAGPEIIATIASTVKRAVDYVVSLASAIADTLIHGLVVIINAVADAIDKNKQPVIDAISRLVNSVVDVIGGVIHKIFPFISEGFGEFVGKVALFGTALSGVFKVFGGFKKVYSTVAPFFAKAKGLFGMLEGPIFNIYLGIQKLSPVLGELFAVFFNNLGPIALVTGGLLTFGAVVKKISDDHRRALYGMSEENQHFLDTVSNLHTAQEESFNRMKGDIAVLDQQYEGYKQLAEEYDMLLDSDGKVKAGQEQRADTILNELCSAMGLEKDQILELIDANGSLSASIANIIEMKKAEAVLDTMKDEYGEAVKNRLQAYRDLSKVAQDLNENEIALAEATKERDKYAAAAAEYEATKNQSLADQYAKYMELDQVVTTLTEDHTKYFEAYKDSLDIYNDADELIKTYENLSQAIETAVSTGDYTALRDQLGAMSSEVQKELNGIVDKSALSYADIYANATKTYENIAKIAQEKGLDTSQDMFKFFQDDILNAAEKYGQFVADSGDAGSAAALSFDTNLMTTLQENNPAIFETLTQMAEGFDISEELDIKANSASMNYFNSLLTNIQSGQVSIDTGMNSIIDTFGIDVTDKAWITTSGYFETILSELQAGSITIGQAAEALTPAFEIDTSVPAEEAAKQYESQITSRFGQAGPNIGGEIDSTMFEALDATEPATEQAANTVEQYAQSIIDHTEDVTNAAGQLASDGAAAAGAQDKIAQYEESGRQSTYGFARGIGDSTAMASVLAAIDQVADAAIARMRAKKNLAVESPSKKFAWIGRMTDEGFALGLVKNVTVVRDAIDRVGNTVLTAMKDAMSGVSDALDADMDYEPTIRPVLDLSAVSAGAGSIDSLLGIQNGITLPTTFGPHGAIAATLNDISAAKVSDIEMIGAVNKLHDDISTLSEDITSMYEDDNRVYEFNLNTQLDGRNIAHSTARYNRKELAILDRNTNRKGGKVR